ncbi:MAG: sulfotransferase [Lysobacterales bacterium]|jgi:tetratricopeptide (TPR) repeat protein
MNPLKKVKLGLNLVAAGRLQEAAQVSARLLAEAPESAQAHMLASEVAIAQDQTEVALGHINRAIDIDDGEPEFSLKKARIQLIARQGLAAQDTAAGLAERFPDDPNLQLAVARLFTQCGNHAGAEGFLLKAGDKDAKNPDFLSQYSTNQFFLGKFDEAEKAISAFLDLELPAGRKLLLRSTLRRQTPDHNHVDSLRQYLGRALSKSDAVSCYYALAKELEDLGEYAQSFDTLKKGAAVQRGLVAYDPAEELQNIRAVIETFQPAALDRIPDSDAQDAPVFIVGLPRTGTTLAERILVRQEGTRSAEETYDFTFAFSSVINEYLAANRGGGFTALSAALEVDYGEIAARYRRSMVGMLGEAERYVDKTPFNYLYCGLMKKAFPNARIIHLVRDPMDACYAVFKALFDRAYFYSYDLEELADYYVVYRQVMAHWHRLMPGAILDVRYEDLVSNPLDTSRQIAEYVGFDWSEELIEIQDLSKASSTASAAQVREPIYTRSVGLWRHFESELEPVRRTLAAAGLVDEHGNCL